MGVMWSSTKQNHKIQLCDYNRVPCCTFISIRRATAIECKANAYLTVCVCVCYLFCCPRANQPIPQNTPGGETILQFFLFVCRKIPFGMGVLRSIYIRRFCTTNIPKTTTNWHTRPSTQSWRLAVVVGTQGYGNVAFQVGKTTRLFFFFKATISLPKLDRKSLYRNVTVVLKCLLSCPFKKLFICRPSSGFLHNIVLLTAHMPT